MNYCKHCQKELINMRVDAKFCSETCRKKSANAMKLQKNEPQSAEPMTQAINTHSAHQAPSVSVQPSYKEQIEEHQDKIDYQIRLFNQKIDSLHQKRISYFEDMTTVEQDIDTINLWLKNNSKFTILSFESFILQKHKQLYEIELDSKHFYNRLAIRAGDKGKSNEKLASEAMSVMKAKPVIEQSYHNFVQANKNTHLSNYQSCKNKLIASQNKRKVLLATIDTLDRELKELEQHRKALRQGYLKPLFQMPHTPVQSGQKTLQIAEKKEVVPVRVTNTETIRHEWVSLQGHGIVLGKFNRTKPFVFITGGPGAGKTDFTVKLIKSFLVASQKCVFLALETGFSPQIKELYSKLGLHDKIATYTSCTIVGLRKLCAQEKYDAVFVDSWQKLNADSEEVDKLRADFPRTSFIMISQVTNDGKMRGGQALYHDATAILDIRNIEGKRTCYTVKSRYDNQNKEYKLP